MKKNIVRPKGKVELQTYKHQQTVQEKKAKRKRNVEKQKKAEYCHILVHVEEILTTEKLNFYAYNIILNVLNTVQGGFRLQMRPTLNISVCGR